MFKKIIIFGIIITATLTLTACSGSNPTPEPEPTNTLNIDVNTESSITEPTESTTIETTTAAENPTTNNTTIEYQNEPEPKVTSNSNIELTYKKIVPDEDKNFCVIYAHIKNISDKSLDIYADNFAITDKANNKIPADFIDANFWLEPSAETDALITFESPATEVKEFLYNDLTIKL